MTTKRLGWVLGIGLFATAALAATPPSSVNYQGVLRGANSAPLTGSFDMVLRFMDAESGGNEILVDRHTVATSNPVSVSGGLFDVALGSGTVVDGSGPGTYVSLAEVFRDHASVWLELSVGAETLSPRTRIHSSPYALNSAQLGGHLPSDFVDTSTTPQTKFGYLSVHESVYANGAVSGINNGGTGIYGTGRTGVFGESSVLEAGLFRGSGLANGVLAQANGGAAGRFESTNTYHPSAELAYENRGVTGISTTAGGEGVVGRGNQYGVYGEANVIGGGFVSSNIGVQATAGSSGGIFSASDSGSYGIRALGQAHGGFFQNSGAEYAYAASQGVGIYSVGPTYGSYFATGAPWFSYSYLPGAGAGIVANGSSIGGEFYNFQNFNYALTSYSTYKIFGIGSVSFVQNHPQDPSKVIVYAAPEGDEVAVYTRGSGKLVHGEARVKLGETFVLVTNPDIGLTATATPRGEPIPLAIDELTTSEMIVRGPAGSNAEFDYMVWGLRIGFEEQSIVQPKQRESKIPSMHDHEEFFQKDPALRHYTALTRYADGEEKVRGRSAVNLERAHQLRDAVGVFPKGNPFDTPPGRLGRLEPPVPTEGLAVPAEAPAPRTADRPAEPPRAERIVAERSAAIPRQPLDDRDLFDVVGTIVSGDVVSLVADSPGAVVRSAGSDDALVVGCAQESEAAAAGRVAVATSRIALCRVDASFGAVVVGDRLIASPAPGTAMRAAADAPAAAALGRAIDPLESGTDVIRVLVSPR